MACIDSSEVIILKHNLRHIIPAALAMLILILDSRTALAGAREGLALCGQSLIPALFPFLVISPLLTSAIQGQNARFLLPLERFCRIPEGTGGLMLTGLLGGYPVGARSIALACGESRLSETDGARMLGFCNNAGPAFLFGMLGPLFPSPWIPWLLWGIHVAAAVLTARMIPGGSHTAYRLSHGTSLNLPQALEQAVGVMANICGWVILFRIGIRFLDRWVLWLVPNWLGILATGLLELSNGCVLLREIPGTGPRFLLASLMLAFGGLCVWMQTICVCKGLSTRAYLPGKLIQPAISLGLSLLVQPLFPAAERFTVPIPLLGAILTALSLTGIHLIRNKNKDSISAAVGV